ncbi:hypothetical protein [Micromonospora sp. WMMD980]|uniref:hypothetical protein n=1 Tax=Micromonospora sp. WMMD980 TaxID=3016088 RepID=UPI002416DC87|nr:hypothetical protein [Micromonospora sp. WMMD980]MDG4803896.1 hypothetical protein [Micromonospora sp. WMMD980]
MGELAVHDAEPVRGLASEPAALGAPELLGTADAAREVLDLLAGNLSAEDEFQPPLGVACVGPVGSDDPARAVSVLVEDLPDLDGASAVGAVWRPREDGTEAVADPEVI